MTTHAKKQPSALGDTIKTVFYAFLIAILIRTFAYEPFRIPSGSMIPTLLVGDYLFVSKFSYGYSKFSFPFAMVPLKDRLFFTQPRRGDVVVFKEPNDTSVDYIKRVIGLPGDTVQMKAGRLYINGEIVPRQRIADYIETEPTGSVSRFTQYMETLPGGVSHPILEMHGDTYYLDDTDEFYVPEGFYFMMGDNRDNSLDSRTRSLGYVPQQNLVGRAEFLFFSKDEATPWWAVWNWPSAIRWNRIFDGIH